MARTTFVPFLFLVHIKSEIMVCHDEMGLVILLGTSSPFLYICVFMDFHTHLKSVIFLNSKIFINTFYIMHSFLRDEDCSREPLQCGSKK